MKIKKALLFWSICCIFIVGCYRLKLRHVLDNNSIDKNKLVSYHHLKRFNHVDIFLIKSKHTHSGLKKHKNRGLCLLNNSDIFLFLEYNLSDSIITNRIYNKYLNENSLKDSVNIYNLNKEVIKLYHNNVPNYIEI